MLYILGHSYARKGHFPLTHFSAGTVFRRQNEIVTSKDGPRTEMIRIIYNGRSLTTYSNQAEIEN